MSEVQAMLNDLAKSWLRNPLVSRWRPLVFDSSPKEIQLMPQIFAELSCAMAQHSHCREYRHECDISLPSVC